jgi:hypothetical protein
MKMKKLLTKGMLVLVAAMCILGSTKAPVKKKVDKIDGYRYLRWGMTNKQMIERVKRDAPPDDDHWFLDENNDLYMIAAYSFMGQLVPYRANTVRINDHLVKVITTFEDETLPFEFFQQLIDTTNKVYFHVTAKYEKSNGDQKYVWKDAYGSIVLSYTVLEDWGRGVGVIRIDFKAKGH